MSTRTQSARRHARLGGVIAALFVATVTLAGCSSSDDSAADGGEYAEPAVAGAEAGGDAAFADAEAAQDTRTSASDRSVIITGSMYMTVEDPIASADQATKIVQGVGGRIDARNEKAPDEGYGGAASLTMRIPSDALDSAVGDLRGLGAVDEFSTETYDVTNQVTDLDAKISTLRASTERIEALLVEAKDITDIIKLETELDNRQSELEGLEAQQRGLKDQVSMSTINLSLTTEPVVIVDDAPESFWDGLASGWNGLVTFISGALIVAGVLLPWMALMAVVALVAVFVARRLTARKSRRNPAPTTPTTAASDPTTPAQQATAAADSDAKADG